MVICGVVVFDFRFVDVWVVEFEVEWLFFIVYVVLESWIECVVVRIVDVDMILWLLGYVVLILCMDV